MRGWIDLKVKPNVDKHPGGSGGDAYDGGKTKIGSEADVATSPQNQVRSLPT